MIQGKLPFLYAPYTFSHKAASVMVGMNPGLHKLCRQALHTVAFKGELSEGTLLSDVALFPFFEGPITQLPSTSHTKAYS